VQTQHKGKTKGKGKGKGMWSSRQTSASGLTKSMGAMSVTKRVHRPNCACVSARNRLSASLQIGVRKATVNANANALTHVNLNLNRRPQPQRARVCAYASVGSEDSAVMPQGIEESLRLDWERAKEDMNAGKKIFLPVIRLNKAGIVCKFSESSEAFLPVAQLSTYTRQFYRDEWERQFNQTERLGAGENPSSLIGQMMEVCVLNVRDESAAYEDRHIIIVSEKKVIENEERAAFDETNVGDIVECYIKSITHFGMFVKMGALDALIHKSQVWLPEMGDQGEDISIDEQKLSATFSLGERLRAVVIKKNDEKLQVSLSMRELVPNRGKLTLSQVAEEMNNTSKMSSTCDIPEFLQLCSILDQMDEVNEIIPGPCIKSGAVAPEFQVLLSSKQIEGGYEVFARKGFHVQEAQIQTNLLRDDLKRMLQDVSTKVA